MIRLNMRSKLHCGLALSVGLAVTTVYAQTQSLPPKKPVKNEQALGSSQAVHEVNRLTQDSVDSTATSSAIAPVEVRPQKIEKKKKKKKNEISYYKEEKKKKKKEEPPTTPTPQSRYWLLLEEKPEFGLISGWVFTQKDLATKVGDGFSFGMLMAQEINERLQLQLRISGSRHTEEDASTSRRLWIAPIEFVGQFSRKIGSVSFYLQPGLGTAAWFSEASRVVDGYSESAKGFDFLASGGIGAHMRMPDPKVRIGADYSISYVSGQFDNYFSRILVYATYQF